MTDHDLLELAAKAAGFIEFAWNTEPRARSRDGVGSYWNPLDDDGDALRLAVKLGMDFRIVLQTNFDATVLDATHVGVDRPLRAWRELHGADPFAATRRAITCVAAEVGRTMP